MSQVNSNTHVGSKFQLHLVHSQAVHPSYKYIYIIIHGGFPSGSDGKESAFNAGDLGSIPRLGRSPEEENGNPLQYSCPENSMDREAWQATYSPWGRKESDTSY